MAPRIKRFDANQAQREFAAGKDNQAQRFVPRCEVCGGFATLGLRQAGVMHLRDPMLIWTCFRHSPEGQARSLARQSNAEPGYSPAAQDEAAAGATPEQGRSDNRAGFGEPLVLGKSVNVVTSPGAGEAITPAFDPAPGSDDASCAEDAFDCSL